MTALRAAQVADEVTDTLTWTARQLRSTRPELTPFFDAQAGAVDGPLLKPEDFERLFMSQQTIASVRELEPGVQGEVIYTAQDMATLKLWRKHRIVYDIDPALWDELADVPDDQRIPDGLFRQLPHPDPYIALAGPVKMPMAPTRYGGAYHMIEGFFVTGRAPLLGGYVQRSTADEYTTDLGLLVISSVWNSDGSPHRDRSGRPDKILTRLSCPTGGQTVGQILEHVLDHFVRNDEIGSDPDSQIPQMVRAALGALIYLCATNADLRPLPAPVAKRIAKQLPSRRPPRIVQVGYQIGASLRAYRQREARSPSQPTGRRVRPHIRRAHFHTYRVGPGRAGSRVRWLSPIPVNATGSDAEKTTVIGVKP